MFRSQSFYSVLILAGICLSLVSCGKKSKESKPIETYTPTVDTHLEEFLSKQDVACEPRKFCPEYMVKIVVFEAGQHHVCTGFLTDSKTVATSTSCLPAILRLKDQDCSSDVFFFLPRSTNTSAVVRRGCSKVLKVSQVDSENPVLWKDDLAFLSLDEPLYRRSLFPTREGMPNKSRLTMWSIDEVNDHFSFIRRDICEVVHNTYFNPLATGEFSPGMTVAECEFKKGNSGSPLIDDTGMVRAVVTNTVDPRLIDYANNSGLLTSPLKLIHNTTNFSCAPTIYDTEVASENECTKELNVQAVDSARAAMLSINTIFSSQLETLKADLEKSNKFIKFNIKVSGKEENVQAVNIVPKCFKDVTQWISTLSGSRYTFRIPLPVKKFKKTMDSYGRIRGQETNNDPQAYSFQFSPNFLRTHDSANLYMWNNTDTDLTFEDFPKCE